VGRPVSLKHFVAMELLLKAARSSRDAAPVCLRGRVLGAARHPWIWARSKLALFTAGGNSMLRDSAGQQAGAWMQGVSSLETAGRTERCLSPSLFPLPYPASDRHGCTHVLAHHHRVGHAAAALCAAEPQVLQRHIAFSGIDDGLQIGRALVVAGFAPHEQAQVGLRQHAARELRKLAAQWRRVAGRVRACKEVTDE
jgi:hypothetical protein